MIYYAIRHIPSGGYICYYQHGKTAAKPAPADERPPRLWTDAGEAMKWLREYCKGPIKRKSGRHKYIFVRDETRSKPRADYAIDIITLEVTPAQSIIKTQQKETANAD